MRKVWVRCEESVSNSRNKEETGRYCLDLELLLLEDLRAVYVKFYQQ